MNERVVEVRPGISLCYEPFGDPSDDPVLLIMGLGSQMLLWHEELCRQIAARGHFVVRFDNRDVGRSTRLDHVHTPSLRRILAAGAAPRLVALDAPYLLGDMADDAAALIDVLGWRRAHVIGASMGGMIAQELAMRHPERVRTLTSIMSTPRPRLPRPAGLRAIARGPRGRDADATADHLVSVFTSIGGPHMADEVDALRELALRIHARGVSPRGFLRHLAAIVASGDRRTRLGDVRVPTLVLHGALDPMVPVSAARETAAAIPGARLHVVDRMGHDLGRALWPEVLGVLGSHLAFA